MVTLKKLLLLSLVSAPLLRATTLETCNEFYKKSYEPEMKKIFSDWFNFEVSVRYSKKLETCVALVVRKTGNDFFVQDMSLDYIKDRMMSRIFSCNSDGANVAKGAVVLKHSGQMMSVPYKEWLDDGEGGPPATLKTPAKPYTRERCKKLYENALTAL